MDGYPDGADSSLPPPPPPPPPEPAGPAVPKWAIFVALAAVAAAISVVVVLGVGGESGTTSADGFTSTLATTTTSPATTSTTLAGTTTVAPTTTATTTPATTSTTTSTTLPTRLYGPAALDCFREIAGAAEFGGDAGVLHRWEGDLRIAVHGNPTARDLRTLDAVVADLNELIDLVEVTVVAGDPNVDIHFVPVEDFASIEPNYVEGNLGYVYIWWDADGEVYRARILISTTGVTPQERSHLIREELTQGLGLLNDSWLYPSSIFYQGWTDTNRYTRLDRLVIEMLYRPELSAGMSIDEAREILAGLEAG